MSNARVLGIAAVLAFTSGCAGGLDHVRTHGGHETLRIVNATAAPLCDVFVATPDDALWGRSWTSKPVAPGDDVALQIRPDDYKLRVGRCDGGTALVASHVAVDGEIALVIHDGYPPTTIASALALPSWSVDRTTRGLYPDIVQPGVAERGARLQVHNRCARDLRVVLGGDPRERSGSPSTLPGHATLRYAAATGTPLWLVDEHYQTLSRVALTPETRELEIAATCDAFTEPQMVETRLPTAREALARAE